MMRHILLISLLCTTSLIYAQDSLDKFKLNDTVNSLYPAMALKLACRYAVRKQNDSSFFYINEFTRVMDKVDRKGSLLMILTSPELNANLMDKRWDTMREGMAKELKTYYGPEFNAPLFIKLQVYETEDQNARWATFSWKNKLAKHAGVIDTLNIKHLHFIDSLLEANIKLSRKLIGKEGMYSVSLFIQHGYDKVKHKSYLEQMKKWFEEGEIDGGEYALYIDRVRTNENKPQIYGSQYWIDEKANQLVLYRLESVADVNKLRKQAGMKSIQYYLLNVEFLEKKKFRRESVEGLLKGNESMQDYISKEMNK